MNSHIRYSLKYLNYLFKSLQKDKTNKTFISDFKHNILNFKHISPELSTILSTISPYKKSNRTITYKEIGAGSNYKPKKTQLLRTIIKNSSIPKKYGILLYRTIQFFDLKDRLEIGTSVGISSLYIAQANKLGQFTSLEGVQEKQAVAVEITNKLNLPTHFKLGNFDNILPHVLNDYEKLDFVFFDGNHTKEATINYFNLCLQKVHSNTVFVFDDIYWSKEMEEAWQEIKSNNAISVSIDLFRLGLIFFNKDLSKVHYVIKF